MTNLLNYQRCLQVTSGFDICNGMFHDSIGNYGYFVTRTYPYITGCFGPGNYPSFIPTCTTNGPSSYTKSVYALNQTTSSTTNSVSTAEKLSYDFLLSFLMIFTVTNLFLNVWKTKQFSHLFRSVVVGNCDVLFSSWH